MKELYLAVEDDDGVLSAADQVDSALRIDSNPGHVPVLPAGGQLLPALDDLVAHRARLCHRRLLKGVQASGSDPVGVTGHRGRDDESPGG